MAPDRSDTHVRLDASVDERYERAPCALLSTLPDGTIVQANQTFFDWIGLSREGVLGTTRFQSLLTIGSRMYYETHYAPLLHMQGVVNEIALDIRRHDGEVCPVVASARQIRDGQGAVLFNRVALFDSSDRRKYEQELLLARKRAEQSAQELTEVAQRKNEFIALLSHELRNPLAPIRSGIEILTRTVLVDSVAERATGMMQRQVSQLARLVDDLLDVSRIGQDKLTLNRVPLDLASVVHHAVEASESTLTSAGLTMALHVPETPIYVNGDAGRLIQVIQNLLHNAAKFTPRHGSVTLVVERESDRALIRVRDTGIGIDPTHLTRIFDLFAQADRPTDRGGLGIGLMLARNLIERHGGRIDALSDGAGLGAEFQVRLPTLTESLESVSRSGRDSAARSTTVPKRILVVDDNHDSADLLAMLLEAHGHDVRPVYGGRDAVDLAAAFGPEIVLLDIGLPDISGYEVAAGLRKLPGVRPLLVALTGWGQDEDRRRSAEAGFDAHLVKPVEPDALFRLIAGIRPDR